MPKGHKFVGTPTCHPDRKHCALGLCQRCYQKHLWRTNEKRRRIQRAWYAKQGKAYTRKAYLKTAFNISPTEYDQLLAAQNGTCALCPRRPTRRPLHVDHKHGTDIIRGLLCSGCNTRIWALEDENTKWRNIANKYLKQHRWELASAVIRRKGSTCTTSTNTKTR